MYGGAGGADRSGPGGWRADRRIRRISPPRSRCRQTRRDQTPRTSARMRAQGRASRVPVNAADQGESDVVKLSEEITREISDPTGCVTASSGQGGECLEAKRLSDGRVAVRATEQPAAQPCVRGPGGWDEFGAGAPPGT